MIAGPPKVSAAYTLPAGKSLVVFVDDRANRAPRRSLRDVVAREAESTLISKKVVAADRVFPSAAATRASLGETYNQPLSIAEIGRRVGADLVLYVEMTGFSISQDGVTLSQSAGAQVKIIDAATGERLFPAEQSGYPANVRLPGGGSAPTEMAQRARHEQALATALGAQIARLFFSHERDALSGRLDD